MLTQPSDHFEVKVFCSHNLPEISFNFEPFLYNTKRYSETQNEIPVWFFMLFRHSQPEVSVVFQCCNNEDQNWISPARAPFGGVQCDSRCTIEEISFLLDYVEQWILKNGGNKLTIKSAPSCYYLAENQPILPEYYVSRGYNIINNHINYSIPVTRDLYADKVHDSQKRRLKKSSDAGFKCRVLKSPSTDTIYHFIDYCRKIRGYKTSLSKNQLNDLLINLPEKIIVFEVKDGNTTIAMSISVRVHEAVLYNFLPASLPSYNSYSPAVILTEGIYDYCQEHKIAVLDLGISLDNDGFEKDSLIRFKENLGGVISYKRTYEKILSRI